MRNNLRAIDGWHLDGTHKSVLTMTPREICNLLYYRITNNFQTRHNDDGSVLESVEEQITEFEEQIGLRGKSNTQSALEMLREDMIRRGIDPDAMPDVELRREWFKEDELGDDWAAYQMSKNADASTDVEDAGLDIEY